jgi:hypothetical protein
VGRRIFAGLLLALICAAPATAKRWQSYRVKDPQATLERLNALRASFGAGPLTLVRAWSNGCAHHVAYEVRNHTLGHTESKGLPGFTRAGKRAAATSVLGYPFHDPFPAGEPLGMWKPAPFHQSQVLNPLLTRTGFAKACLNTIRGQRYMAPSDSSEPPRILAWPGDGASRVPRVLDACVESPVDPFTKVGWRCNGSGTAFYLWVLDPEHDACPDPDPKPAVTVTANGRTIEARVTRAGDCGWVAVTHGVLPKRSDVTLSARAAGATIEHTFST